MTRRRAIQAIGMLTLTAGVAGGALRYRQARQELVVDAMAVTKDDVVQTATAVMATIQPREERVVAADRPGRLAELRARLGQRVRQGDVLAVLADPVLEAEASQAELDLVRADRNLKRTRALSTSGFVAPTEMETAEYQYGSAAASMSLLRARRNQLILRAPIDGAVTAVHARPGEVLGGSIQGVQGAPAFPVLTLSSIRDLVVKAYFDEADIDLLFRGQEATVAVEALAGHSFRGQVERVAPGPSVTTAGNSYEVLIGLAETATTLLPGFTADARVVVKRVAGTVNVAREAVFPCLSGRHCVYLLAGDRVTQRPVQTGISNATSVEIKSGLSVGEMVIVGFPGQIREGARVRVRSGRP